MATITTTAAAAADATAAFEMTTKKLTAAGATATMGGPLRPSFSNRSLGRSHTCAIAEAGPQHSQPVTPPAPQSLWATTLLITTLCGVTFASSMTTGVLAVALPTMARELNISGGLMLW